MLQEYDIREISSREAQAIVIENHYLHRRAPCMHAWGLFLKEEIKGVIMYGTPAAAGIRKGVAGPENASNVLELTRLWVDDIVPRNGESYLIGNTVRLVSKEIIVSYAEIAQGHVGTVYQATNWLYTGLSAKRTNWQIEGLEGHNQSLTDRYTSAEAREKYGDRFKLVERPRKHRYVFINADKRRKKQLLKELRYPILPYPKLTLDNIGQMV